MNSYYDWLIFIYRSYFKIGNEAWKQLLKIIIELQMEWKLYNIASNNQQELIPYLL